MTRLLEVRDLALSFVDDDRQHTAALRGVDLEVDAGESIAIVGESGSGKSVTALAIMGLLPASATVDRGSINSRGTDLLALDPRTRRQYCGRRLAMVFQDPMCALNPYMRVGDQVLEAVSLHKTAPLGRRRRRVTGLFREVGIPDPESRVHAWPHQLSGGLRQRVMIAMALAGEPELLIADEPTTALDVTVQAQILDLFRTITERRGMGLLLISHDLGVVATVASRVAVMYAGRIVEEAPAEALYAEPRHPYTRGLLATLPRVDAQRGARLEVISGAPPAAGEEGPPCAFEPRCPWRAERCLTERPETREPIPGHRVACHEDPR